MNATVIMIMTVTTIVITIKIQKHIIKTFFNALIVAYLYILSHLEYIPLLILNVYSIIILNGLQVAG